MAENIVHIVLPRLPGAPEGTKGFLFIVPKFNATEDGTVGDVLRGRLSTKWASTATRRV